MCLCVRSDLLPLAQYPHRLSHLYHTHAHTQTHAERHSSKSSAEIQPRSTGQGRKAPQRHTISCSFWSLIFLPLKCPPPLIFLNPHLHIHRQKASLSRLLSKMGRQHLLFVALQMEESHFPGLWSMEVFQFLPACVCACTPVQKPLCLHGELPC